MPLIPFPNVPNVPGVPAIARSATVPSLGALVNLALGGITQALFGPTVWGVFDENGMPALQPDSFIGVDFRGDAQVSSFPIEQGGFASFNKVQMPFDCRIQMSIGTDRASRTAFLETVEAMKQSIERYTVITPEVTYLSATLQTYSYRRDSKNGVTLIVVDLWFLEVREVVAALFSETENPSGADPISGGQVQTFPVDGPGNMTADSLVIS